MATTPHTVTVHVIPEASTYRAALYRLVVRTMPGPELAARALAVLDIHRPSTDHDPTKYVAYCVGCCEAGGMDGAPNWPCPTVVALARELEDDDREVPD